MQRSRNLMTRGEKIFQVVNNAIMALLCIICIYPLWYVLVCSISDPVLLYAQRGIMVWPLGTWSFRGYRLVMENPNIPIGFRNTLIYMGVGTLINMFLTTTAAYGLSRKHCYWNGTIMKFIAFTMYFQGGTIPSYIVVESLGLINSRWSMILPGAISTFNMIVMRTAMAQVPDSLPESAMIDGASHPQVLFRIMTPLCKATVAVIVLYYAVAHWNSWFSAFLYLRDKPKFPLQLILRQILFQEETNSMAAESLALDSEAVKYATIVVATVPILMVYPFLQKYFVKGVMVGAVKG